MRSFIIFLIFFIEIAIPDKNYAQAPFNLTNQPKQFSPEKIQKKLAGLFTNDKLNSKILEFEIKNILTTNGIKKSSFINHDLDEEESLKDRMVENPYDTDFVLYDQIIQVWRDSIWINSSKNRYTHDSFNNRDVTVTQYWDGNDWYNHNAIFLTYDADDNLIERLHRNWDGQKWVNELRVTWYYDLNNELTEGIIQIWGGSSWINSKWFIWDYSLAPVSKVSFSLVWDDSVWVNSEKNIYTFLNDKLTQILHLVWDSTYFMNKDRTNFEYFPNIYREWRTEQQWDGNEWVNTNRIIYSYRVDNRILAILFEKWSSSNWIFNYEYLYTYDTFDNLIEFLRRVWNGVMWEYYDRNIHDYDSHGNRIQTLWQRWDNSKWENFIRDLLSYISVTTIDFEEKANINFHLSNNYPNPFNATSTIGFKLSENEKVKLSVINILGEEITILLDEEKQPGEYSVEFNASDLPSGVYFYQLKAGNFIDTKKMLLLK